MSSSTLLCAIMEKLKVALENRDSCSLLLRPKVFYFQCKSMTSIVLIIWHLWQGRKENILKRLLAHHLIWAQTRLSVPHGLKKEDVEKKTFIFYYVFLLRSITYFLLRTNIATTFDYLFPFVYSNWIPIIIPFVQNNVCE